MRAPDDSAQETEHNTDDNSEQRDLKRCSETLKQELPAASVDKVRLELLRKALTGRRAAGLDNDGLLRRHICIREINTLLALVCHSHTGHAEVILAG